MTKHRKEPAHEDELTYPVVAVGASAGGLQAFKEFLSALPPDTGMSFVLIQHLAPQHESILAEILTASTSMPVLQATEGILVEPDHVYVIPPDADMAILHGHLHMFPRSTDARATHMPIDYFFSSLAQDMGALAIGIVLSGVASDGAHGLQALRSANGMALVQDPKSAEYDGMPRAALAAGPVDLVRDPADLARELSDINRHPFLARSTNATGTLDSQVELMQKIFLLLREATGVDFTYYKQSTIDRRILRRMAVAKLDSLHMYVEHLRQEPAELRALYDDIIITVTSFFRDPAAFEALEREVFPRIREGRRPEDAIRVWVPGCATGQEAYSIAIALTEYFESSPNPPSIQVFATDIQERSVEYARKGIYPAAAVRAELSPGRISRFFSALDEGYQVSRNIRQMCVFARHDVTVDPPFSRLDLVSCRNLLIYMGAPLQKKVLPMFHWALRPGGHLLLGTNESVGHATELFEAVEKKAKLFRRVSGAGRLPLAFGSGMPAQEDRLTSSQSIPDGHGSGPVIQTDLGPRSELQREADRIVLERFGPAGVVVDEQLQIVSFRGRLAPYLEPSPGRASFSLLDMAHDGIRLELRRAILRSQESRALIMTDKLTITDGDVRRALVIEVAPIRTLSNGVQNLLVLFREVPLSPEADAAVEDRASDDAASPAEIEVDRLLSELADRRRELQYFLENRDAVNEELRASNEELQSSGEEMQSINEELETAKEELQSSNEELLSVNEELQVRNSELNNTTSDLDNFISSTNIPMVVLGLDMRVRMVTPQADPGMNIRASNIGQSISDIKLNIDIDDIEGVIAETIDSMSVREFEVRDRQGGYHSLRMRPYVTKDKRIDGVSLALLDMSERKAAEEIRSELAEKESKLHQLESLGQLAGGIAHDFNNLLGGIFGYIDLASDASSEDEVKKLLSTSLKTIERARALTTQLLTFSTGGAPIKGVAPLFPYVQATAEFALSGSAIELIFHIPAELWLCDFDRNQLAQVIDNLVKNARQATPSGGSIHITAENVRLNPGDNIELGAGDYVALTLRDSGGGIDPQVLPKIFDPFFTTKSTGSGLGLATSRSIINKHGGAIEVESELGVGSTFRVYLPAATAGESANSIDRHPMAKCADLASFVASGTALVMDDEEIMRESMRLSLSRLGFTVVTCSNGRETLDFYRAETEAGRSVAAIFLDLTIHGSKGGVEVCKDIRSLDGDVPIFVASGYAEDPVMAEPQKYGFTGGISKPFTKSELAEMLERHLSPESTLTSTSTPA